MSEKSTDSDLERGSHVQPPQHHHGPSVSWFRLVYDQALVTPEVQNWRYAGSGTEEYPFVVVWIDNDPRNPMTWPDWQKWCLVALVSIATLAVAFVSSAYTGGLSEVIVQFQTSQLIVTLGVSLFVLGFAIGPLMWAPMSEIFGRQVLFIGTYAALTAFNAGAAGAQNITTLLLMRFFAGSFGSSPLTNAGGIIADMFDADQRGLAMTFFASAPFLGPVIGPIVGGFAGETIGWRWVEGIMAIFTGILWIAGSLLIPETYAPVLLRKRARALEKANPGKIYKTRAEIASGPVQFVSVFSTALIRPWKLLFGEPIVLMLSIYMAIIYGTLYLLFAAFPIVYQQKRGWSPGIGGLAFLGVAVGMLFAIVYCLWDNKRYKRVAAANNGNAPPEARLPMSMVGACALPIGLFWFAWTNSPSVHWMASIAAGAPFGFGMILVFLGVMNYLIDAYTIYAASALAANSVLRSLFGMAFPLFTSYMYANLGIHWASCIPAFLALMCLPMPVSDSFSAYSLWKRITELRGSADFQTM
ncbi:synaptic vesicle transporter [Aureobasidium pullulans]|uniref:Synaptic vesicle transporter n=1 Tax=Aureobasidium pullulans TaxID=5580 RepID=A0A4S8X999_AURPU|nr:synaptic vesicle transporter [Aureobasidium pullulans]